MRYNEPPIIPLATATYFTTSSHRSTMIHITTYTVNTSHLLITPTATPLPYPLPHDTSPDIPTNIVHTTIHTTPLIRPGQQSVTHYDTTHLQSPTPAADQTFSTSASTSEPHHLYLNDLLIDLTIQILHRTSRYCSSHHYVSSTFTNQLTHHD